MKTESVCTFPKNIEDFSQPLIRRVMVLWGVLLAVIIVLLNVKPNR